MSVELERPTIRHADGFLAAVRRSRALHRNLVTPPDTVEKYRAYRLVRSLGFRLEGLSRKYLKISGRWRDHER